MEHVWDNSVDNFSNSIRVHISALRKKLRAALGYDPVRNRIGEGYLIEEDAGMKKLSLQWRITLMTALLICSTCMAMNWLIGCSGRHYMDSIGANLSTAIDPSEGAVEYFDPSREGLDPNLTIVIYGAQNLFHSNQLVHHGGGDAAWRAFWPISSAAGH